MEDFDPTLMNCAQCKKPTHFTKISRRQHICPDCRSNLALAICSYCKAYFNNDEDSPLGKEPVCGDCQTQFKKHGAPGNCEVCHLICSFGGAKTCRFCSSAKRKYGDPVNCAKCGETRAFVKKEGERHHLCLVCISARYVRRSSEKRKSRDEADEPMSVDSPRLSRNSTSNTDIVAEDKSRDLAADLANLRQQREALTATLNARDLKIAEMCETHSKELQALQRRMEERERADSDRVRAALEAKRKAEAEAVRLRAELAEMKRGMGKW